MTQLRQALERRPEQRPRPQTLCRRPVPDRQQTRAPAIRIFQHPEVRFEDGGHRLALKFPPFGRRQHGLRFADVRLDLLAQLGRELALL